MLVLAIADPYLIHGIAMTLAAAQLMKLANRNAQRRIAAGGFPDFNALGTGAGTDANPAMTEGSA